MLMRPWEGGPMATATGFGRVGGMVLIAWLALGPAGARAEDAPGLTPSLRREGIRWPGEGGKRIRVSIGLYLVDFARINLREESFDMAGYLDSSWVDPTLALGKGESSGKVRRFRPGQIWAPALEFVNAVEQVNTEREGDLYVADDGRVIQRTRFSHKFQSPLDLRRFPFDSQTLSILIVPFDPFAEDLELVVAPERVGRLEGASVTDWDILRVDARVEKLPYDRDEQRFHFEVKVARRSTFYIWRVLVPMTLLVMTSWSVFWFEPVNLQPQISTGLAILLSLVTFTYAIDFSLPKVAYLTFIDRYTLTAFAFVLLTILTVAAIHVRARSVGAEGVAKIQARSRVAFPVGFLAAVAAIAVASYR